MTYEEFEALCVKKFGAKKDFGKVLSYPYRKDAKVIQEGKPALYNKYSTGGVSGGSCWDTGDEPTRYNHYTNEPEEFYQLDSLLEEIAPNISFLHYKKVKALVNYEEDTVNEYYGNSTDYKTDYIYLEDLYNILSELGYV
jgi:hypothetical protein